MTEAEERRAELAKMLEDEFDANHGAARRNSLLFDALFWGSLVLGGLAAALGLIPPIHTPAWVISLIAAASSGCVLASREGHFRERAEWFYEVRDTADFLRKRLLFEMPEVISDNDVATISREWRERRSALGGEMARINRRVGRSSKTE